MTTNLCEWHAVEVIIPKINDTEDDSCEPIFGEFRTPRNAGKMEVVKSSIARIFIMPHPHRT